MCGGREVVGLVRVEARRGEWRVVEGRRGEGGGGEASGVRSPTNIWRATLAPLTHLGYIWCAHPSCKLALFSHEEGVRRSPFMFLTDFWMAPHPTTDPTCIELKCEIWRNPERFHNGFWASHT